MSDSAQGAFETLCRHVRQIALLSSTEQLLGWDERTMLPAAGGEHRAEQMTLLAGMIHSRWTDPELGGLLDELADSPLAADGHSDSGATIRRVKRQYGKCVKLPQKLVEEMTRVAVLGQQAWERARIMQRIPGDELDGLFDRIVGFAGNLLLGPAI